MSEEKKKLLVLGGSASMIDLVKTAKRMGIYTVVTDWNSVTDSPAKQYADSYWDISIMDYDNLVDKSRHEGIDGVITCMTDSYLTPYRIICERLGLPCYLTEKTEEISVNKLKFKKACADFDIPVAKRYYVDVNKEDDLDCLPYPIVVKPADGSGSRGFKVCYSTEDVKTAYNTAEGYSSSKQVIIEDYIPYDSTIIHYTLIDGKCYYSGMSDKISCSFKSSGASVMGLQLFPSKGEKEYLYMLDEKVRMMFETLGFRNGPVWIEAFYDGKEKFIFNEMRYRFGGSFTYYPVQWMYNFSQMELLISFAVNNKDKRVEPKRVVTENQYCIIPVHCKPGIIKSIVGETEVVNRSDVYAYAPKHFEGQEIKDWGTALQVFCYLHVVFLDNNQLKDSVKQILGTLKAYDMDGQNLLYTLYDIETL